MVRQALMRVVYVSQFADVVGGGEHSLMELIANLPESITAELVVPENGELAQEAGRLGLQVHYLPMPKIGFMSLNALRQWKRWLKGKEYDFIHANQSRAAFYAGWATLGQATKVIFHCRIAKKDGLMDAMLMRLSDAIICNSKAVADRFKAFNGVLKVIYNGVVRKEGRETSVLKLPDDARLLLFVGRLSSEKQPQLALDLFEKLAGEYSNLHLAMVGGDDPHDSQFSHSIREKAASSLFVDRIHMPGALNGVTEWYQRASLLVLTSKHEGFGRVLVEAMAEGVVPVAFSVGGVPEVVEHGEQGFLVEADDLTIMQHRLKELLDNELLRNSLAENGRGRAAFFSIENHVASIEALYQELLQHG